MFINAYVNYDQKYRLPHFYEDEGLFWTNTIDKNRIFPMLDNIELNISNQDQSSKEYFNYFHLQWICIMIIF